MSTELFEIDQFDDLSSYSTGMHKFIKYFLEPFILILGIIFNLLLLCITYTFKRTNCLHSTKPLRYLLISMLISDTWFLLKELNVWYFLFKNGPDLTSFDIICQLSSYFSYFLSILLEVFMISADFILLKIALKKTSSKDLAEDVYNDFLNEKSLEKESIFQRVFRKYSKKETESNLNEIIEMESISSAKISKSSTGIFRKSSYKRRSTCESNQFTLFTPSSKSFMKLNLRREDFYFSIILKEKLIIILSIFIWMYLLSFLLWIKGVKNLEPSLQKESFNSNYSKISDSKWHTGWPIKICITHSFAVPLFRTFQMFLTLLKNFALFMNIFSSIIFHVIFRKEYLQSIKSTFTNDFESYSSRTIKIDGFYFIYSTKTLSKNISSKKSDEKKVLIAL